MSDRNIGAEILDGIQEIKQFKKGKLALRESQGPAIVFTHFTETDKGSTRFQSMISGVSVFVLKMAMRTKSKCVTTTEGGNDYDDSQ